MPRDPLKSGSLEADIITSPHDSLIPKAFGWITDDERVSQQLRMDIDKVIAMGDTEWFVLWKERYPVPNSYQDIPVLHATGYYDSIISKMEVVNKQLAQTDNVIAILVVSPNEIRRYTIKTPDDWWYPSTYKTEVKKRL